MTARWRELVSRRRRWILPAAVLIAGAVVVAVTIGGGSAAPTTLTASDGRATLTVDPAALPPGVSLADLSIRPATLDGAPTISGFAAVAAYELQPHGLRLRTPAMLTVELEATTFPAILAALHVGDAGPEPAELSGASVGPDDATITLSMPLTHFSTIYALYHARDKFGYQRSAGEVETSSLSLTVAAPTRPLAVGEAFQAAATLTSKGEPGAVVAVMDVATIVGSIYTGKNDLIAESGWTYQGEFKSTRVISEPVDGRVPAEWTEHPGRSTFIRDFRCERPGFGGVSYTAHVRIQIEEPSRGLSGRLDLTLLDFRPLECVGGVAPTAQPTPSASASGSAGSPTASPPPPRPSPSASGRIIVCGLPGGPTCPPRATP